jgi:hypothetical protein
VIGSRGFLLPDWHPSHQYPLNLSRASVDSVSASFLGCASSILIALMNTDGVPFSSNRMASLESDGTEFLEPGVESARDPSLDDKHHINSGVARSLDSFYLVLSQAIRMTHFASAEENGDNGRLDDCLLPAGSANAHSNLNVIIPSLPHFPFPITWAILFG